MLDRIRKFFRPRASALPVESLMFECYPADYAGPFHVTSREPAASCVRLRDGRLHVISGSGFPDLLDGPEYILVSRALADVLRNVCGTSIKVVAVEVINVATGETITQGHFDVIPHDE